MTDVERAETQQLFVGEERELIIDKFDIPITRGKLKCLEPGLWPNDEVINFHMKMLQERNASGNAYAQSWFCSTFFFRKLTNEQADGRREYTYKNVMRWADDIAERPAVKRGLMVNRTWGEESRQLHERHDASDFELRTQDKLEPSGET